MLKIYGTENSRAMRPIWTAEEMGLEYELVMMPFPPRDLYGRVSWILICWEQSRISLMEMLK
jgi:hypothetical protein